MKKAVSIFKTTVFIVAVLMLTNNCKTKKELLQSQGSNISNGTDVLETIYSIADKNGMRVISDLNMPGGAWYGTISAEKLGERTKQYINEYHIRYGKHKSFWGWYLNNEINPIKTSETEKSMFWRKVWKAAADECHRVRPESMVTISPFFLLDKDGLRGFEYLEPSEYEEWWTVTLKETGIDVLMLQDSGAEHQAFFTLNEREPFFAAFANACRKAGSKFWMNVETGQVDAKGWPEAMEMERNRQNKWEFTDIDWLSQKLNLATKYGEAIVNWGYYPMMNPSEERTGPFINNIEGQDVDLAKRKESYLSYKLYYEKCPHGILPGNKTRAVIQGTLWYLPANYSGRSKKEIENAIEKQIRRQKAIGFNLLWLCNTPTNMEATINEN